jgi:hypothetical protein
MCPSNFVTHGAVESRLPDFSRMPLSIRHPSTPF